MLKEREKRKCGSTDTATRRPCQISIYPCPLHTPNGERRPRRLSPRRLKLTKSIAEGKSIAQAGREAGYSAAVIKAKIYQIVQSVEVQQALIQAGPNDREKTKAQTTKRNMHAALEPRVIQQ